LKEGYDCDVYKSYGDFINIFELSDNKTTKKFFNFLCENNNGRIVNMKQALHVIVNNTNLHHEEKFKLIFLLYSRTKNYISSKDLENILKINLRVKSKIKESLKKINESYSRVSDDINIDVEYEFGPLFEIYRANINLFI
jgi:hypothetical protein